MEHLLATLSKTDINCPTCTPSDDETLLSVMISSKKQIVTDTSTSPLVQNESNYADPTIGTISIPSSTVTQQVICTVQNL